MIKNKIVVVTILLFATNIYAQFSIDNFVSQLFFELITEEFIYLQLPIKKETQILY